MTRTLDQRTIRTYLIKQLCAGLIVTSRTIPEGTIVEGHCDEILRASYKIEAAGLDVSHMSLDCESLLVL